MGEDGCDAFAFAPRKWLTDAFACAYPVQMQDCSDIRLVVERLALHGISVARLCRRADLAESTWHRWTKNGLLPRPKTWRRVTEAVDALVEEAKTQEAA
jgi:hypothetical protein